jgi:predicted nuclease with TOPRIM domain
VSKHDDAGDGWGSLTEAARSLERELRRFEDLTTAARRIPLDRQRTIERAAKATTEAAAEQARVDDALRGLAQAIEAVRERHQATTAALQARGEEIRTRAGEVEALLERWRELGDEGQQINALVHAAAERQREATTPEGVRVLVGEVAGIEERMAKLVEGARVLVQAANAVSVADLAEQAEALRQQVAAARNKMGLLRKALEAKLPAPN